MTSFSEDEHLLFTPATPNDDAIPIIFAFPNEYSVGITSLGYQVVWATLASRADLRVGRLFTDSQDGLPPNPEMIGFSVSWELDYINILGLLEQLRVPLRSSTRGKEYPLIFGGGPVLTANPEPFADFFDVILLGDGELVLADFIDAYREIRHGERSVQLRHLAQRSGIYVPSMYESVYQNQQGPLQRIIPLESGIPSEISKQTYRGNTLSTSTVVTPQAAWESIYMVEVVRSCPELCRFCLASYLTLPFRVASLEDSLIPAIDQGLEVTDRIGLLGASVTQHPEFDTLLEHLNHPRYDHVRLSIASVRTSTVTPKLATTLTKHQTQSITIAVESGSEKVRRIVNKKLDTEDIVAAAIHSKSGGLKGLKLYGMVGVPGETMADVEHTAVMMETLKKEAPGLKLTLGCSTFVPKAHTPFQWYGVSSDGDKRLKYLQKRLRSQGIDFRPESYKWSLIQALLARGDRRLSHLLEYVYHCGHSLGTYRRGFKELGDRLPPLSFYTEELWDIQQPLPWQHLQGPLPISTLMKHLEDAQQYM